jgi:NTP pyrophosphatase (non-canonical NTP hydrolase)
MLSNEYQRQALETAIYPNQGSNFLYPTLGLVGEAGEVAEKVKKIIRDGNSPNPSIMGNSHFLDETTKEEIAKELSDVCWYIAVLANELGYSLGEIMEMNLFKLRSRQERGVLGGSGDNR